MPPVPDKARIGRFFGRRVTEFQNWMLPSNARWRLTDEPTALLWQAEFPNSCTRYTMKRVRTVRNLFNLGRRNNDRPRTPIPHEGLGQPHRIGAGRNNDGPRTPIPQYDPAGNPVLDMPYF